jgi:hypothetical protein
MAVLESVKRRWQEQTGEEKTPLAGDTTAWAVSLIIHVVALLGLALIGIQKIDLPSSAITIVAEVEPIEEDLLIAPEMVVAAEESSPAASDAQNLEVAMAVASEISDDPVVTVDVAEAFEGEIAIDPLDLPPTGADLGAFLQTGRIGEGDTGVGIAGTGGAVDRLTVEIAASLQQRTTVVCWVFDQSVSLAGQRREIAERLDRVFEELGLAARESHGHELLNLVFAYGQKVNPVVTQPTQETAPVVSAIDSILVDESGVEMTFTAIAEAAKTVLANVVLVALRVRALLDEFAQSFGHADIVLVPDIYFVRDSAEDAQSVSSADLVAKLRDRGAQAWHIPSFEGIVQRLDEIAQDGDLVVVMGAGPVWEIGRDWLARAAAPATGSKP